jgi:hypothetical protein
VIRAVAKGAVQLAFGRAPGGFVAYRALTRGRMGTAASHVDKLARVWPGYVSLWRHLGIPLEGRALWVHDAGATPFLPIAVYLLTGRGATVTLGHEQMLARYLVCARRAVLEASWPAGAIQSERRLAVEGLRWVASLDDALEAVGARMVDGAASIAAGSIDLCHSGGALEHEEPAALDAFLAEQVRVLGTGGFASHVVDHRDHLHHADRSLPFLAHLAWSESTYRAMFGHALGYHARLSPTEVAARFAAAGLRRVAVRRLIYDARSGERRWVEDDEGALAGELGLPRSRLAARFRAWSDADLRTAAAHYVYAR